MSEFVLISIVLAIHAALFVWLLGKPSVELWNSYMQAARLSLVKTESGENNNTQAKDDFLYLISEAQHSIEVFDDGDTDKESVYQDHDIVAAIQGKLTSIEDFTVVCHFNNPVTDLWFAQQLAKYERVTIHPGIQSGSQRPDDQVHYKIADGGRLAYLSQHGYGEGERNFRRVDCRALKGRDLQKTAQDLFGNLQRSVEETCGCAEHEAIAA